MLTSLLKIFETVIRLLVVYKTIRFKVKASRLLSIKQLQTFTYKCTKKLKAHSDAGNQVYIQPALERIHTYTHTYTSTNGQ